MRTGKLKAKKLKLGDMFYWYPSIRDPQEQILCLVCKIFRNGFNDPYFSILTSKGILTDFSPGRDWDLQLVNHHV